MERLDICFVSTGDPTTDTFPDIQTGGSGPIWRLAQTFASRGHEVTVYSGTYGNRKELEEAGVKIVELPTPAIARNLDKGLSQLPFADSIFNLDAVSASPGQAIERLFGRLLFSWRTANEITQKRPDVVYLRDRVSGTFPARLEFPTVHTVKSPDACDFFYERSVSRHPANRLLFYYRQFLEEHVIENADQTLVMNERMKQYFESKGFFSVSVVSLGINEKDIYKSNYTNRKDWILYVGRFDGNKRPEWLVDAYAQSNLRDIELHFVGSGQREDYLREEVYRRGLDSSVVFHGRIPRNKVLEYMRQAKVFVLPSEFENCPNVVVEAMGSGCPPIASDTHGARHLISHGETGLLFNKDDKSDLRKELERCLSNAKLREKLSQNAVDYIQKHHTVAIIADKYLATYKEIR